MSSNDSGMHRSNTSTPASNLPPISIKQEPQDNDWGDSSSRPNSVPTATVQPEPVQKHQRLRYYGRKHVASPDTAVCEVCQGEFRGPDVLQVHKLCHFNTSHVCYVCDCYFPNTEVLILHMATNHRNLSTTTGNYKPEAERSFVCVVCLQRFSSNKMLMKHQRTHTEKDDNYNGCKVCALEFADSKALLAHLSSSRHKEMKVKIQSIFVCVDCRSIFATRDSYAMHMMMRAQSETCDKMTEDDGPEVEATERKVMDLLRGSVQMQDSLSSMANTMAMNAMVSTMASNGLLLNNIIAQEITPENKALLDPGLLPFIKDEKYSSSSGTKSSVTSVDSIGPLNLSTATSTGDTSTMQCSICFAKFHTEDSLIMHKTIMHKQQHTQKRNPTVSDLLQVHQMHSGNPATINSSLMMFNTGMTWTCVVCGIDQQSCDALAMHMMEKHANQDQSFSQFPDAKTIREKVQKVYLESKLMQVKSNNNTNPGPIKANTPAASPVDPRSKSTGAIDERPKTADIKAQKRRLSLQDESFLKKVKQEVHVSDEKEWFSAMCPHCGQTFNEKELFLSHCNKCAGSSQQIPTYFAMCSFCRVKFRTKEEFIQHLKSCQNNQSSNFLFGCGTCEVTFNDRYALAYHCRTENHIPRHSANSVYKNGMACKQCNVVLPDVDALLSHVQNVHHSTDSNSGKVCSLCGWSTHDSQLYVQHMLLHNVHMDELDLADGKPHADLINGLSKHQNATDPFSDEMRRSRRKPLASAKVIPSCQSPDSNDMNHMWDGRSECSTPLRSVSANARSQLGMNGSTTPAQSIASNDDLAGEHLLHYLMENVNTLSMCKHCKIVFTDRTMYHLHMGLHNRNDPWQCNLCGKATKDVHEFSSHVIHY